METSDKRDDEFWYCQEHHRVEKYRDTDSTDRIGPFDSYDAAAHALQTIADREKRYDAEDEAWDG